MLLGSAPGRDEPGAGHSARLTTNGQIYHITNADVLSMIKLRQAEFAGCRDSLASLLHWTSRMVVLRLVPPILP